MKTRSKVYKSDIPEKPIPPSNIASKEPKNSLESGVSVPHFEANSQKEGEFSRRVVAFFANDKGEIAWDRMRDATKNELREFIKRPDVRKNLRLDTEIDSTGRKSGEPEFGQDEAEAFFDLIQGIERIGSGFFYGSIPLDIRQQAFTISSDHRKKMSPSYIRLMNKWGPLTFKKYKDEIGALIITLAVLNSQVQTMHILDDKRKRATSGIPAPNKNVTPISEPEPKKEVDLTPNPADTLSAS